MATSPNDRVQFTRGSAERIAAVVRDHERSPTQAAGRGLRLPGGHANRHVVKLTSRGANAGFFGFTEMLWNPTTRAYEASTQHGINSTALGEAREISGRRAIPLGQLVCISPSTTAWDTDEQQVWEFDSPLKWILARITGVAALGATNARWKYAWSEVELDGDSPALVTGGLSGTTSANYAINLNELDMVAKSGTTAWYVDGVQANSTTSGSAYPTGFAPRPISGGGTSSTWKINTTVQLTEILDKNGAWKFAFSSKVNHDGSCA